MKKISGFLLIFYLMFQGCAVKTAHYPAYTPEPENILEKVEKKPDKKAYKQYKKKLSYLKDEWNLYKGIRESLGYKNYERFEKLIKKFYKNHYFIKNITGFTHYAEGIEYYRAVKEINTYNFEQAVMLLKKIPENSFFKEKADILLKNLNSDSDNDGYIDQWEILEGYNPLNPYSHP